jgi:hypothetical protein
LMVGEKRPGWGGFRGWGLVLFCFGELTFLILVFGFGGEGGRGRETVLMCGVLGLRIFLRWRGRLLIRSWGREGLVRVM